MAATAKGFAGREIGAELPGPVHGSVAWGDGPSAASAPDPYERLSGALSRVAANCERINAEIAAIAAESRASIARLEAMQHVNPLAHLIGDWNV